MAKRYQEGHDSPVTISNGGKRRKVDCEDDDQISIIKKSEIEWSFDDFEDDRFSSTEEPESLDSATLCDACETIFSGAYEAQHRDTNDKKYYPFQLDVGGFLRSVEEGCQFCSMRLNAFSDTDRRDLGECREIFFNFIEDGKDYFECNFKYTCNRNTICQNFSMVPEYGAFGLCGFYRQEDNTNSWTTTTLARVWEYECTEKHTKCQLSPITDVKPTRLIYLGEGSSIRPRLYILDSEDEVGYATLSHCWGDIQPLQLLKSTIEELQGAMDTTKLPLTFRHAMEVARRLLIYYIWIDSLCIIQDDEADWLSESAKMSDIYQNAKINIAATWASNGTDGLYSSRRATDNVPCLVDLWLKSDPWERYIIKDSNSWITQVENSALMTRAWVTQELILAPRVLHFAKSHIFWECRERRSNEIFPWENIKSSINGVKLTATNQAEYFQESWEDIESSIHGVKLIATSQAEQFQEPFYVSGHMFQISGLAWKGVVEQYSRGRLTFPMKDKLVACSSLSKMIIPGEEVVAGLRKARLPHELLWKIEANDRTAVRPSWYQAPSWSWASINHPVTYGARKDEIELYYNFFLKLPADNGVELVQIVDVKLFHVNDDCRAGVSGGFMKIWAPLIKGSFNTEQHAFEGIEGDLTLDDNRIDIPETIRFLAILEKKRDFYGIFISPVNGEPGTYTRIGHGKFFHRSEIKDLLVLGLTGDDSVLGTNTSFDDGIPRYLIRLV